MESKKFFYFFCGSSAHFLDGNCEGNHLEMKCDPKIWKYFLEGICFSFEACFVGKYGVWY